MSPRAARKQVFAERPRVAEARALADAPGKLFRVRTALGVHHRHHAVVLALAVTGAEAGDNLIGAGDGFGVNHRDPGMQVPKPGHLRGAVGIRRPEVMEVHLAAVHVFPAGVENATVGQRPGRIVLLVVAGERAKVRAIGVATMQHGDLGEPAVDPAFATAAHENDPAIGQVGGLEVVVRSGGELLQRGAVGIDFVKVILLGAAGTVAEQNLFAVVTDLRVSHAALWIGEQRGQFAGRKIETIELRAFGVGFAVGIVGVIAEVRIPMSIGGIHPARCEDDGLNAAHRAIAKFSEQIVPRRAKRDWYREREEREYYREPGSSVHVHSNRRTILRAGFARLLQ